MTTFILILSFAYLFLGLDDLIIDLIAWSKKLFPTRLPDEKWDEIAALSEKKIAILVPAWKEFEVIRAMLTNNYKSIEYRNYEFFVGIYPNDLQTLEVLKQFQSDRPEVPVTAVINSRPGPTSKAQMLNVLLNRARSADAFDIFLIHDAEDVIHPRSLRLLNWEMASADFVQIPIFSLPLEPKRLIGGTYIDEFAEVHTKDLLVRAYCNAGIPSAGVGTGLSSTLVHFFLKKQGEVFREGSLTEDYELGIRSHQVGLRTKISCHYLVRTDGTRDYIATREFFPNRFAASIRQKTRWTVGIAYQGWRHLGWTGGLAKLFFLYHDRKGIIANPLTILGYAALYQTSKLSPAVTITLLTMMTNRFIQRAICVARVYGTRPLYLLWLRLPIANVINAAAALNATKQVILSTINNQTILWSKTEHEYPT